MRICWGVYCIKGGKDIEVSCKNGMYENNEFREMYSGHQDFVKKQIAQGGEKCELFTFLKSCQSFEQRTQVECDPVGQGIPQSLNTYSLGVALVRTCLLPTANENNTNPNEVNSN